MIDLASPHPLATLPPPARAGRDGSPAIAGEILALYTLRVRDLWAFLRAQPLSFWVLCAYLFLEYIRPQQSLYSGLAIVPLGQASIILCLGLIFLEGKRLRSWGFIDTLLAGFTCIVLLSSVLARSPHVSADKLHVYLSWLLVYFMITTVVNTEGRFLLFLSFFFLFSLYMSQGAVRQWAGRGFTFASYGVTGAPAWFSDSGEFAIQMIIFLSTSLFAVLALRRHWTRWKFWLLFATLPVSALIGVLASSSRGAQIGLCAVALWFLLHSPQRGKALAGVTVLAVAIALILPPEQKDRFREMGEDKNSIARLTTWRAAVEVTSQNPVLGIGYANWLSYYRAYYDPEGLVQHNIFLQASSELGFPGAAALVALMVGTVVMNRRTRKLARRLGERGRFLGHMTYGLDGGMVGFVVAGFFVTVLYYPFFWINLAMTVALHEATRHTAASLPFHGA